MIRIKKNLDQYWHSKLGVTYKPQCLNEQLVK